MADYDPQRSRRRPRPTESEPAPVDELLDVATADDDPVVAPPAGSVTEIVDLAPPTAPASATRPSGRARQVLVVLVVLAVVVGFVLRRRAARQRRQEP